MLQHRRQAAEQVARSLFETEAAIDAAIAAAAKLTGLMPSARTDAKLSAVVGQDAFEIASVTLNELIQARRSIVQTHHTLAGVQDDSSVIETLDPAVAHPIKVGFAESMDTVFLLSAGAGLLAFLILLLMPRVELRATSAAAAVRAAAAPEKG